MEEVKETKKPRTEAQKAATAKALAALKARREIAKDVIDADMKKEVEDAEERIVAKVMSRMGGIKKEEEETPEVQKAVKKAAKVVDEPKKKKVVVVEESDSSSEEEVVIKKVKKNKGAIIKEEAKAVLAPRSTGNKLLDRLYGFA